jgi:hypothetical protein
MSIEKKMYFDHPTHHAPFYRDDMLEYKDYAEAIYRQIGRMKPNNMGITFGVLGEWGMGKTTVLNILAEKLELDKKNSFEVIRFSAWQYLRQEELWLALIRKIVYEIHVGKSWLRKWLRVRSVMWVRRSITNPKFIDSLYKYLVKAAAFCSLAVLSILGLIGLLSNLDLVEILINLLNIITISIGGIEITPTKWVIVLYFGILVFTIGKHLILGQVKVDLPPLTRNEFDQGQIIAVDDFKDDFYAMVKSLGKEKTVVVLIDDLDRCPPNQIVPVLEAIKHLGFDGSGNTGRSDMAKLVFVLAIDQVAVEQALSGYFKEYFQGIEKEKDIYQFAKNYIGKIIQVPILLPPLTESQLDQMLSGIMKKYQGL